MRVLVTGGAGFIGSHLIQALLAEGNDVVCVDDLDPCYDPSLKRARLALFRDRIDFYELDIADPKVFEPVFQKHQFDAVCHLAAQAGVRYSLENPLLFGESNIMGTLNVLEFSKRYKVPHVVFASTSSIYGKNPPPFSENDRVDEPVSIYAATKRAGELLAYTYHHAFGLRFTALRFFTVYGPWGRPDMALFKFVKNILAGEPIDVYNKGDMRRDFTYIADIVSGFMAALKKPMEFEIINLGHGDTVPLMDFIATIERELGMKAKMNFLPMPVGDVPITHADPRKAKELLGWEARVAVGEGVKHFVEWYREYYKIPS